MTIGGRRALVTTEAFYDRKVAPWRGELDSLELVLLRRLQRSRPTEPGLRALLAETEAEFETVATQPEDLALMHFTCGTTGTPKGAVHVQKPSSAITPGRFALDLHPRDIYWCTADPGWVTGTSYGIISPLKIGVHADRREAEFEAERWYRILQHHEVTVWYSAPTAIRMLMKVGDDLPGRHDLSRLRFLASVGEPLNPEAVVGATEVFGRPFHDNWWQTETGGIMIANFAAIDIKPGSMGRPLPGVDAAIVKRSEDGGRRASRSRDSGELALRPGWPSMFRGYLNQEERYTKCFAGGWYLTGTSRARRGGLFLVRRTGGRRHQSAGHLIGPFEVESALIEHPAVAEAGVIGVPDERMGEAVRPSSPSSRATRPPRRCARSSSGMPASGSVPAVAPREHRLPRHTCRRREAARSCAGCLKARESGCRRATSRPWRTAANEQGRHATQRCT